MTEMLLFLQSEILTTASCVIFQPFIFLSDLSGESKDLCLPAAGAEWAWQAGQTPTLQLALRDGGPDPVLHRGMGEKLHLLQGAKGMLLRRGHFKIA